MATVYKESIGRAGSSSRRVGGLSHHVVARNRKTKEIARPPDSKQLSSEERLEKWVADYEAIKPDIIALVTNHHVWKKFLRMVQAGPAADIRSYFWKWLRNVYSSASLTHFRRVCEFEGKKGGKKWRRTRSLHLLLANIRDHADILTVNWYIKRHGDGYRHNRQDARRDFESLCGKGAVTLPRHVVVKDLDVLEQAARPMIAVVDQYIAHSDRRPVGGRSIRSNEFDAAVKAVETVAEKYGVLLTGSSDIYKATIVDPWQRVFDVAWRKPVISAGGLHTGS